MMYCHGCLKRIWFWESRVEGRHVKCLPIEGRCKYYHIQRDCVMSAFLAVIGSVAICTLIVKIVNLMFVDWIVVGLTIFIFLFCNFIAYKIRKKEEKERK